MKITEIPENHTKIRENENHRNGRPLHKTWDQPGRKVRPQKRRKSDMVCGWKKKLINTGLELD